MTVMNDQLERLISNNRHSIQDEEPLEGHFERFEARLRKASKPTRTINFRPALKIAAIVVFALLAVNQARIWFFPEKKETFTLGSISAEYREVEFYYTNAIQVGMNQWEKLGREGFVSESEQQIMQKEQQEFDQVYQKLQEELKANPDDERVINAMLEYYQARMNVITIIINKLQEVKQQKDNNGHEIKI
jgi:cytochrome c-type biogenesis protein CcmH/NrfG